MPYLWPKRPKNHTRWGRTDLYRLYKGVPPDSDSLNEHVTDSSVPSKNKKEWESTTLSMMCHTIYGLERRFVSLDGESADQEIRN